MRTVEITELHDGVSGYLQNVREDEEIIVSDQTVPVARITSFRQESEVDRETCSSHPLKAADALQLRSRLDLIRGLSCR